MRDLPPGQYGKQHHFLTFTQTFRDPDKPDSQAKKAHQKGEKEGNDGVPGRHSGTTIPSPLERENQRDKNPEQPGPQYRRTQNEVDALDAI